MRSLVWMINVRRVRGGGRGRARLCRLFYRIQKALLLDAEKLESSPLGKYTTLCAQSDVIVSSGSF